MGAATQLAHAWNKSRGGFMTRQSCYTCGRTKIPGRVASTELSKHAPKEANLKQTATSPPISPQRTQRKIVAFQPKPVPKHLRVVPRNNETLTIRRQIFTQESSQGLAQRVCRGAGIIAQANNENGRHGLMWSTPSSGVRSCRNTWKTSKACATKRTQVCSFRLARQLVPSPRSSPRREP